MPSQVASSAAGVVGAQVSPSIPAAQVCTPVAAHTPTPQLVAWAAKSSSATPSQSSSRPSQMASSAAGVPGVQVISIAPPTHDSTPEAVQAPVPQVALAPTKSSSKKPSQSSSMPSQVASFGAPTPVQTPATQVSTVVQATPSSQGVWSATEGCEQAPAPSQTSSLQELPSSVHAVPAGSAQACKASLQVSPHSTAGQTTPS